jgi:hypothetical protein
MENLFEKFPLTLYNNTLCRDITRRVKIDERTKNALTLYYTYEVKGGARADLISDAYYEEPTLDWLLWMTNNIVDPYYQWNLSENDFNDFLIKKYGSVENSIKKIVCYRNNWYNDDKVLTPEFYENTLDRNWKKYYAPFYGNNVKILYWKRREEDWVMETNKIYKLYVSDPTVFVAGELVDVKNTSTTRVGGGEITAIGSTYILLKNIDGSFANNNIVTGEISLLPQTITDVALVYEAIKDDEGVFWSPVTYFDIENEKNAYNRSINILDKSQLINVVDQMNNLLKE